MAESLSYDNTEQSMAEIIQQDSLHAFNMLYDKYAPSLLGVIKRMVINESVSEVIFQKVITEIWHRKATYDTNKERLFTWMLRITRTITINLIRCNKTTCQSEIEKLHKEIYSEKVEHYILSFHLAESKTPFITETEKAALNLIYFKGYTLPEAAAKLAIPIEELADGLKRVINLLNEQVAA